MNRSIDTVIAQKRQATSPLRGALDTFNSEFNKLSAFLHSIPPLPPYLQDLEPRETEVHERAGILATILDRDNLRRFFDGALITGLSALAVIGMLVVALVLIAVSSGRCVVL